MDGSQMNVIATNSQEFFLLTAFRNMTDGDREMLVRLSQACARENPRKQQKQTRLRLVPSTTGGN